MNVDISHILFIAGNYARTCILTCLILSSTTFYGQKDLVGLYERKWSAHSSIRLFPDSTFEEKYLSFSCGMYASVFKDRVLTGTWHVQNNILELRFAPTAHDKSWNITKYVIDTAPHQLIQVGMKDAPFLDYVKTKEFDKAGNITWELNPQEIFTSLENMPPEKKSPKRDQLVFLLRFWTINKPEYRINSFVDYKLDVLYSSPLHLINDIHFIGQLKYMLSNPGDTNIVNQKKAGLTAIAMACNKGLFKKYKNKNLENLVAMNEKGTLEEYIRKKLQ